MRKILAGLMATAMVTSICATASFAAVKNTAATGASTAVASGATAGEVVNSIELRVDTNSTDGVVAGKPKTAFSFTMPDPAAEDALAKALDGLYFADVKIGGKLYGVTVSYSNVTAEVQFRFDREVEIAGLGAAPTIDLYASVDGATADSIFGAAAAITNGTGGELVETEKDGNLTSYNASDVFLSDGDGNPTPLTESGAGVDKDLNGVDGVQSTNTVYFKVRDDSAAALDMLEDDGYFKMKIAKGDNGKYVDSVSDVTKIFNSDLYDVNRHATVLGTGDGKRHRYVKVVLKENLTDDEIKIKLDVRLTATSKAVTTGIVTSDATMIKVKDFQFYMKNMVKTADNDWRVGINGLMLNPLGNDWNDVTYYDEDADVAFLRFFGDSDVGKFYAKLSTKWVHADYAAYFNDQDAFYFEFTGSPKMSATSRADLQIYNPFTDEDGNSTFDAATATIYQVIDGDLIDVTDSFTFGEGENGEDAFITRTRFIGTYIICEKPVEEAVGEGDINDLVPDDTTATTPDDNTTGGGKGPANTGRYA